MRRIGTKTSRGAVPLLLTALVAGAAGAQDDTARRDTYFAMKRAFVVLPKFAETQAWLTELELSEGRFDIAGCQDVTDFGFAPEDPALANLAHDIVYMRAVLQRSGVDPALWRPPLIAVEEQLLTAALAGDFADGGDYFGARYEISNSIVEAVGDSGSKPVVNDGGCGAGEVEVAGRLDPPGATLAVIPFWNWLVCQERGLPADDPDQCVGWNAYTDRFTLDLAGDYRYVARWPDGAVTDGTLSIGYDAIDFEHVFTKAGVAKLERGG